VTAIGEDKAISRQSRWQPDSRVRTLNAPLAALIREGAERSMTFRGLLEAIEATDGLVYVASGRCGGRARACLVHRVTVAGPNRLLHILVDVRMRDRELISAVAHELQHAMEVLSNPTITTDVAVIRFYLYRGVRVGKGIFETREAIDAGTAVHDELGRGREQ
jgi:hypothetical protein